MWWFIGLLMVGFLVYAAGRETRFGGLGLLWRTSAGLTVIGIVIITGFVVNENRQNKKYRERQAIFESLPETRWERRQRLGLPEPFQTVLSFPFPSTTTQKVFTPDGSDGGTVGWEMRIAELPNITPSTRKTGFFLGVESDVVSLNDGEMKLVCTNTNPHYQKVLSGCRPVRWSDKKLGHVADNMPYESRDEWTDKIFEIGTKVEFYAILPCTDELLKAKEPCKL